MMTQVKNILSGPMLAVLSLLVTVSLVAEFWHHIPPELLPVIFVVIGMLAMAMSTALQYFIANNKPETPNPNKYRLSWEPAAVAKIIEGAHGFTSKNDKQSGAIPWELKADQLVGIDNALALAKLRIDIEREVRHIAFQSNVDLTSRTESTLNIARELNKQDVLPTALLEVLTDVVRTCNQAIHGQVISAEDAADVVKVGEQLLTALRSRIQYAYEQG